MTIKGDLNHNKMTEPTVLVNPSDNLVNIWIEDLEINEAAGIYLTKEQATKLAYELLKIAKPSSLIAFLQHNVE